MNEVQQSRQYTNALQLPPVSHEEGQTSKDYPGDAEDVVHYEANAWPHAGGTRLQNYNMETNRSRDVM